MFTGQISTTPFTVQSANEVFGNKIYGGEYRGDVSLLATARALIAPRMPDDCILEIHVTDFYTRNGYIWDNMQFYDNTLNVVGISDNSGNIESIDTFFESIDDIFSANYQGFQKMDSVTALFKKSFRAICYVNKDRKTTVLLVDRLTMRKLHYLQCCLLGIVPWYFDPSKGMTDLEKKLVYSFRNSDSSEYEACLFEMSQEHGFEEQRLNRLLDGFESRYVDLEISRLVSEINAYRESINDLNARIADKLHLIDERNVRRMGLVAKKETSCESEILEYFRSHKNIYLENVEDRYITFVASGFYSYYDEDVVIGVLNNRISYAYSYCDSEISKDDMETLMRAIFVKGDIKMKTCAAYRFEMGSNVEGLADHDFSYMFKNYMPNPHIDEYSCLGSYVVPINECIMRNDYIMAIEQSAASCLSINWADAPVMEKFFYYVCRHKDAKIYHLPDGTDVNITDAIAWLK